MKQKSSSLSLLIAVSAAVICFADGATAITIGLPADVGTGNCIPFGCSPQSGTTERYQQVYAADAFAGPITIGEIQFHITELPGGLLPTGTFSLRLSTTSVPVGSLSEDFNNAGPDDALFAIEAMAGGTATSVFSITGTAFHYDPAQGNLLLDITGTDLSHPCSLADFPDPPSTCAFYDFRGFLPAQSVVSRVTNWGPGTNTADAGLVTTFLVPEPSTAGLSGLGLLWLSLSRWGPRRRSLAGRCS